ncbi:MAG: GDP-mannose mannosyl hydrolase [Ignavibacterium sp.]
MKLSFEDFKFVLSKTPLFAIDLLIKNDKMKFLLGLRKNAPAKNYYFVPGGRVFKDENLKDALKRISKDEIGIELNINNIKPFGIYEHIYQDNFFEIKNISTHYIIFACESLITININDLPKIQNKNYILLSSEEILASNKIHQFTKNYFVPNPSNLFIKC